MLIHSADSLPLGKVTDLSDMTEIKYIMQSLSHSNVPFYHFYLNHITTNLSRIPSKNFRSQIICL